MFVIPWVIAGIRRGHLGDNYEDICNADADKMYGLRCFRDIGFETFTKVHDLVSDSITGYMMFASLIYFSNMALYVWMVYRLYTDFAVTLLVSMYLLEAAAFGINSVSQLPSPDGFTQLEPETISFFLGLVTLGNVGIVSMRASMCFMLFYDATSSLLHRRIILKRVLTLFYVVYCSMFLLLTHQMYTFSLIFNIMLAFSAHHLAYTWSGKWEYTLQKRAGIVLEEDAAKDHHFLTDTGDRLQLDDDDHGSENEVQLGYTNMNGFGREHREHDMKMIELGKQVFEDEEEKRSSPTDDPEQELALRDRLSNKNLSIKTS